MKHTRGRYKKKARPSRKVHSGRKVRSSRRTHFVKHHNKRYYGKGQDALNNEAREVGNSPNDIAEVLRSDNNIIGELLSEAMQATREGRFDEAEGMVSDGVLEHFFVETLMAVEDLGFQNEGSLNDEVEKYNEMKERYDRTVDMPDKIIIKMLMFSVVSKMMELIIEKIN